MKRALFTEIIVIIYNLLSIFWGQNILTNKNYNYHLARFIISAPDIHHLPLDKGVELAFVGRSNSGKSSALNTLTNQKNLARNSKRPGCTQLINLFEIESGYRLVDLPGYGYADIPEKMKQKWQCILGEYLQMRNCLKGLVVLMDIRHPLKNMDKHIIQLAVNVRMPLMLLLSKADKLSYSIQKAQLNRAREAVLPFMGDIQVEIFSAPKKIGVDRLSKKLNRWFDALKPVALPKTLVSTKSKYFNIK